MAFAVLLGTAMASASADARTDHRRDGRQGAGIAVQQASGPHTDDAQGQEDARVAGLGRGGSISCVPYARQVTGIAIRGNGRDWWNNAAGLYARSDRPEIGSVLSFPASGGMRLGHVAAVSRVLSAREILIDHANWAGPGIRRGTVMRGISVVDVSPDNDWTAVRVQVGWNRGSYGRVYPTHGFIHNRPDPTGGTMLAERAERGAPRGQGAVRTASAAGRGRVANGRPVRSGGSDARWEEIAEAPRGIASPHASQHLDLSIRALDGGR